MTDNIPTPNPIADAAAGSTPRVTAMRVVPVAGRDSMLLNLSGAHGPFFTRNLLIVTDNAGRTGVGSGARWPMPRRWWSASRSATCSAC